MTLRAPHLGILNLGSGAPSSAIAALRENPSLRAILLDEVLEQAREYDRVKTSAAVVARPEAPILAKIGDRHQARSRSPYNQFDPRVVFESVAGLDGFPAYQVFQQLNLTRLNDKRFRTHRNDILDEWHALYSPYVQVAAYDRPLVGRMASAQLPMLSHVTARLVEAAELLAA